MIILVTVAHESFVTYVTLVGLGTCVYSHVHGEVRFLNRDLIAERAFVEFWLMGMLLFHVKVQTVKLAVASSTVRDCALEFDGLGVALRRKVGLIL
jgi:hypothetical protein